VTVKKSKSGEEERESEKYSFSSTKGLEGGEYSFKSEYTTKSDYKRESNYK
jgi:hypothetical protein